MNEHQAEILLTRVTSIASSLDRLCAVFERVKIAAVEAAPTESKRETVGDAMMRGDISPNEARANVAARDAETQKEEKARHQQEEEPKGLNFDDLSMTLAAFSRGLPRGVFAKYMKKSILPKYANGGGISTIAPESYEDVAAECADFYESRTGSAA